MDINKFALSVFDHFLEETQKKIYVFIEEKNQKENAKRGTDIYIYIHILLMVYLVIGEDDKRWNSSTEKGRG